MTRKQALAELIAKVEAGDIERAPFWKVWLPENPDGRLAWHAASASKGSLDAAKALHEAVLCHIDPQFGYLVGPEYARIVHPSGTVCDAQSKIPARAWLLAILRALHSMETEA